MSLPLSYAVDGYVSGTRHPRHEHDCLHFSMVLRGKVAETVGATTEYASPLSVVAKDPGVAHANNFGPEGAKLARLSIAGTIGDLIEDPARSPGWRWTHDPRVAMPFLRLVKRAGSRSASFDSVDADVVDLLAAFTARPANVPRGRPPEWLDRVMQDLRSSWTPGTTVTDIARRAGVHPVYLARVVRRWYSTGLADEMRRIRFRRAVAAIADAEPTLSTVAHASGYSDHAHLCREVRSLLDVTPREYRWFVAGAECYWRGVRSQS